MIILSIALLGLSLLFPTTVNIEPTPVNQPGQNNGMGRKRRYADYGDYADYGNILIFLYRGIQKLRWQIFGHFWPPTHRRQGK